jgi:hypothetical protein
MRIVADRDELDEVSRMLVDVARSSQELADVARRRLQNVSMPAVTFQAVAPIIDAVSRTLASASDSFLAESGGLERRASCCASEESGGSGRLSTLAADNWPMQAPSAADVALGFGRSPTETALADAILHWQATGGGSEPDDGFTVIAGAPIAAFDQLLRGPTPGDQQTIGGAGFLPEIAAILENRGPLTEFGGELDRAQSAFDNALTNADRMHAITPGIPRGQSSSPPAPTGFQLDVPGLTLYPLMRIAFPGTAGLAIPIPTASNRPFNLL